MPIIDASLRTGVTGGPLTVGADTALLVGANTAAVRGVVSPGVTDAGASLLFEAGNGDDRAGVLWSYCTGDSGNDDGGGGGPAR